MSIHHTVTIHCDGCGTWIHGDTATTAQRRRDGWRNWRDAANSHRHLCPNCTRTTWGEEPPGAPIPGGGA